MYFSQNTDRIGINSASTAYCEAGATSRKRILQPSLNSYVQDFLIYLRNTAWGGEKLAKGGHVRAEVERVRKYSTQVKAKSSSFKMYLE